MKPTQMFPPELLMRAQDVKVAFLDVDGQIDDDLISGSTDFVVLEENISAEL